MKKSQEAAAETKSKGDRCLRFIIKGSIVELKLLQRVTEIAVLGTICRIKATINHRVYLLISRKCLCTGVVRIRYRITHAGITDILDAGCDISDHTCCQLVTRDKLTRSKISNLHNLRGESGRHHMDPRALFHTSVLHSAKYDNTLIRVINRVEDQSLQRCIHIPRRRRDLIDDLLQDLVYIQSCFCGDLRCILRFNSDHILDLIDNTLRIRTWKVDLVDHRNHIQIMVQCHIYIGKCLSFDSLCCIHNKDRSVTGSKASGNFIVKVHMSRGIDQVKNILISVLGFVYNTNRLGFDGDSSFSLKVHVIQNLGLHFPLGKKSRHLDDTVRKC